MNLSPDLINRLISLKSLLDLGDMELVSVASTRLAGERGSPEVAGILEALEDHRYAEAVGQIDKLLSDGTRLVQWADPQITLLEKELEQVTAELADLETELAEHEHLVFCFEAAHNEALGQRTFELLKLRLRLLKHKIQGTPNEQNAYAKAKQDFDDFQEDQKIHKQMDAKTMRILSAEQHAELKRLYRKGSKRCHPDLVPIEHHDAASQMFRELRKAYDEGNVERLRRLVEAAEAGLFDADDQWTESGEKKKLRLIAKIATVREAMERTLATLTAIKESSTYTAIIEHADWAALFADQSKILDQEIQRLSATLKEIANDDA